MQSWAWQGKTASLNREPISVESRRGSPRASLAVTTYLSAQRPMRCPRPTAVISSGFWQRRRSRDRRSLLSPGHLILLRPPLLFSPFLLLHRHQQSRSAAAFPRRSFSPTARINSFILSAVIRPVFPPPNTANDHSRRAFLTHPDTPYSVTAYEQSHHILFRNIDDHFSLAYVAFLKCQIISPCFCLFVAATNGTTMSQTSSPRRQRPERLGTAPRGNDLKGPILHGCSETCPDLPLTISTIALFKHDSLPSY